MEVEDTLVFPFAGRLTFDGGFVRAREAFANYGLSPVTVAGGGGGVDVKTGGAALLYQPIDGPGTFTKTGAGELQLWGNSSYTGGTVIAQGVLAPRLNACARPGGHQRDVQQQHAPH